MGIVYNALEIYEMGVQIEKNGELFYNAAAGATVDPEAGKLFRELALWERTHVELFEKLKVRFAGYEPSPVEDPDEQQRLYLKAAADSHIFNRSADVKAMVSECRDAVAVLRLALKFEKDSVVLYTGMKKVVPEILGRDGIDRLIDEEMQHVSMIQSKIAFLDGN